MPEKAALLALVRFLDRQGYDFVTPTPATHKRLLRKRGSARAGNLRDIFGWSLPFSKVDPDIRELMEAADIIDAAEGGRLRSALRVSRVRGRLFLHSNFPTTEEDAVFLGPDSYRFADFILANMPGSVSRLADVGAGAGVGGLIAAGAAPGAEVVLTDLNPKALALAEVAADHAGIAVKTLKGAGLSRAVGQFDLILANPPYMADEAGRTYRDGGGALGAQLSIDWAKEGAERLRPGGRMLLYSGSAIVEGRDGLKAALAKIKGVRLEYRELDPDVFGEEITKPGYDEVERIAAIGAVLTRL